MTPPLVALEIGSTKVACAIGLPRESLPGFELLGSSLLAYPAPSEAWLSDPLMVGRTIEQALEATAVSGDFHRALVAMSHPLLAHEQVRASILLGDEPMVVRAQDLDRLRVRALDQVLSVDREPLAIERLGCSGNGFDGVQEPVGRSATRLAGTFHIVTMPMAARRAVVQSVESAGLEAIHLTWSLPAVAASVIKEHPGHHRVLLIDLGGLNTDLGLFVEGRLRNARTVPWGGLSLAIEIARSLQVTLEQAISLSLEGLASRKAAICQSVEAGLQVLQQALEQMLQGEPLPETALITGRGALMDGVGEWVERVTTVKTAVARSPQTQTMGELAQQMALSPVLGLLELATQTAKGRTLARPTRLVDRLIDRTKTVLTEYF